MGILSAARITGNSSSDGNDEAATFDVIAEGAVLQGRQVSVPGLGGGQTPAGLPFGIGDQRRHVELMAVVGHAKTKLLRAYFNALIE